MDTNQITLIVNGKKHHLHLLLNQRSSIPRIDVEVAMLNMDKAAKLVSFEPAYPEADDLEPMVYKHEGQFILLVGKTKIDKIMTEGCAFFRAHLVSSPALKKARIVEEVTAPVNDDPEQGYVGNRIRLPDAVQVRPAYKTPFGSYDSSRPRRT
jgi:hypothetical protein